MSEIAQNSLLTAYIYQKQVKNSIKIENIFCIELWAVSFGLLFLNVSLENSTTLFYFLFFANVEFFFKTLQCL